MVDVSIYHQQGILIKIGINTLYLDNTINGLYLDKYND